MRSTANIEYVKPLKGHYPQKEYRKHPGYFRALTDQYDDQIMIFLDHSNVRYIVHGGIYLDFLGSPEISRLGGVRQLGLINANQALMTHHTRIEHGLATGIMNELITRRNGLDEGLVNLSTVSGLLHDTATPAYSEYGKLANRGELNEEDNIVLVLDGLSGLLNKYEIKKDDVVACVRGEHPVIGKLLNSDGIDTDKISYTGLDIQHLSGYRDLKEIDEYLKSDPFLFDIYEDIRIVNGNPVFSNPKRVTLFLKARATMFRYVYFDSPREAFFETKLRNLWSRGILTREKLISMIDGDLDQILLKDDPEMYDKVTLPFSKIREVQRIHGGTLEEAKKTFGNDFAVKAWDGFNPATSTLVQTPSGIKSFEEAYPEEANKIKSIADSCKYIGVYEMV